MFHIVLVEPKIPPNTGNIIRLCANTGVQLHLIEPLGFPLNHAKMRRAGLDYHELANIEVHSNWSAFIEQNTLDLTRLFTLTTRGTQMFHQQSFMPGDGFVFGSETQGLSTAILEQFDPIQRLRLPMCPNNRSLNLSNAVAICIFEAWRQNHFNGSI